MDMTKISIITGVDGAGYGFGASFGLALAMAATGVSSSGPMSAAWSRHRRRTRARCSRADEIQPLAANGSVGEGVSRSIRPLTTRPVGMRGCRHWPLHTAVIVLDAARTFPGMTPDQIKQRLAASVKPGTRRDGHHGCRRNAAVVQVRLALLRHCERVSEVAASWRSTSMGRSRGSRKDQAIALLKSAASRLSSIRAHSG